VQPNSRTAGQPRSRTAVQPCSRAAEQPNSRAAMQPNSRATKLSRSLAAVLMNVNRIPSGYNSSSLFIIPLQSALLPGNKMINFTSDS